jgi:hypothetical protein
MALLMPCFPAALPHGFSACGVFLPFLRLFSPWGFFVRASAFSARCVAFCRCGLMLPRLVLFLLFCRQIFLPKSWPHSSTAYCCRCKGLFFGVFQKAVFWLTKGGLLQPERIPFAR